MLSCLHTKTVVDYVGMVSRIGGRIVIKHQLLHYIKYSLAFSLPSGNALNNNEEYSHNKKSKKIHKKQS